MRPTSCLAALVLLAAAGSAQAPTAAVRELKLAAAEVLDDAAGRARALTAVAALQAEDGAVAVEAFVDTYMLLERAVEPELERRERVLRGGDSSSARLARTRHRVQRVRDVEDALLAALAGLRSPAATTAMVERFLHGTLLPWTLRLCLADRCALAGQQLVERLVGAADAAAKADAAVALLRAFAALGPRATAAVAWVIQQVRHADADVRLAAVAAVRQMAPPQAIAALVERVDVESGTLREQVLDALVVITGQWPGDAGASWRAWLAAEGKPYVDGAMPLGKGDPAQRSRKKGGGDTVAAAYFGIPQDGNAILYIVDRSQSMGARAPGRGPTTAGPGDGGARGGGQDLANSRWRYCLDELREALGKLRPEQTFNVVAFADAVVTFEAHQLPATPQNTTRALAWLEALGLQYQTNTYDALDLAFLLAGRGTMDRYYPCEIDTMFLLTDGEPTRADENGRLPGGGAADDPRQILAAVRRWNALARVRVHTIGVGLAGGGGGGGRRGRNAGGGARVFLRDLAAQNRGTFVDRR